VPLQDIDPNIGNQYPAIFVLFRTEFKDLVCQSCLFHASAGLHGVGLVASGL
jgi:hypothetical protein